MVGTTDGENDLGDSIKILVTRENIFADRKSVRQSEFYQAAAVGLKPEITFEIRTIDYEQEPILIYNEQNYTIIRTFEKQDDFIELICQGTTNGVM